ncbi:hypothetical protein [Pseudarthrobacter sp. PH31-O2]|uniref:hypothetical protein n=1 Tax=Pseudarthrobacter sp. PH31-O2 TaxID=3046206 RepID=UPI0024B90CA5|nr:hypothetical protein [Pseudarthrobacter sp. PH31-O2]MDJ0352031.1 hypothetical protein [Pseudarthrobacter sp. PH31-O2]
MSESVQILEDVRANRGRPHLQFALLLFRLAQASRARSGLLAQTSNVVFTAAYRAYALSVLSLDIPVSTKVSPGLVIHHGMGLVVHNDAVIGRGVTLRQNTTIGAKPGLGAPKLLDGVDVGANSVIIGNITIGENSVVGAGAVVTVSIPENSIVVGNPARILRVRELDESQ